MALVIGIRIVIVVVIGVSVVEAIAERSVGFAALAAALCVSLFALDRFVLTPVAERAHERRRR